MVVLTFKTTITPEHMLTIQLPDDVPTGTAQIVVVVNPASALEPKQPTLGDLLNPEFFGMWRERLDLPDSPVAARALREKAWDRWQ